MKAPSKLLFLQSATLNQLHFQRLVKLRWFFLLLIYSSLFGITYLNFHFLGQTVGTALKIEFHWPVYVGELLFQILHTGLLAYFLHKAFRVIRFNLVSYWYYLLWFLVYYLSGLVSFGLWFYLRNLIVFDATKPYNLLFFIYFGYFLIYCVLLEVIYNLFIIKFNAKLDGLAVINAKYYLIIQFLLCIYLVVLMILLRGDPWMVAQRVSANYSFWLAHLKTPGQFVLAAFLIILALIPLLLIFYCVTKTRKLQQHQLEQNLFQARAVIVISLSELVYFAVEQTSFLTGSLGTINQIYLAVNVIFMILVAGLLVWNHYHFNSGAVYFLVINFFWTLLVWALIVLYLSGDTWNLFTGTNSVMLAISSTLIFVTYFFNKYQINKWGQLVLNTSWLLIGLLFPLLLFFGRYFTNLQVDEFDIFLIFYIIMGLVVTANFGYFLVNFVISIKRLRKRVMDSSNLVTFEV